MRDLFHVSFVFKDAKHVFKIIHGCIWFFQIVKEGADAVHTPIEIVGSPDSQKKAKEMINEIVLPQQLANKMEGKLLKVFCDTTICTRYFLHTLLYRIKCHCLHK